MARNMAHLEEYKEQHAIRGETDKGWCPTFEEDPEALFSKRSDDHPDDTRF